MNQDVLLRVEDLKVYFPIHRGVFRTVVGHVQAVDGVSFTIRRGETLGLVGESGCGKTTTGRAILKFNRPISGKIYFDDQELVGLSESRFRPFRRRIQMIFQDPYASLNPRMTVKETVGEPLMIYRLSRGVNLRKEVQGYLELVGLSPQYVDRYPHEFSGGQRQRIGIARALALRPDLIVCDEPISALDVSIQAQVVNLLKELQKELHLTYLFIAHDLSMVRHISDRVAVMYLGTIVELASSQDLYAQPMHPYTQALMSAVPIPDPKIELQRNRTILTGDVPSADNPPSGCHFRTRCPLATEICATVKPRLNEVSAEHYTACYMISKGG
ncbi:MAG: ATP-binding cassette domain-containing protein [Chloroflexi bacterium]|nr:ATP-binding cassette domain-containing protein [Chloroflexota bacterium]